MKIFWREISIKKTTPEIIEKKNFLWHVWGVRSSFFSEFASWLYTISLNTFYDLYKMNWDIRQAVRKIANSVSRNWIYLVDMKWDILDDWNITSEINNYFKTPTFLSFKIDLFRNYLLSGELYIIPMHNLKWEVKWFQVIDSRLVSKNVDQYGNIIEYIVSSNVVWSPKVKYRLDEMSFFKLEPDVNYEVNGMWLLHWIVYDALSDLEAMKTNYSLYENQSIPNSMLLLNDDLSENEIKIAKEQFETEFRGSTNAHKILIWWGVKEIKTISLTPRDMEFINQRKMTTEKISAVFGVPKSILWYVDNVNYSNGREMRKEFLEWTIRPYEVDFENIINTLINQFLPKKYDKYVLKGDGEQLEETNERYEWQRADIDRWILTINEVRIDRWLPPSKEPNCDKHITSRWAVLLEDIALDPVLPSNE